MPETVSRPRWPAHNPRGPAIALVPAGDVDRHGTACPPTPSGGRWEVAPRRAGGAPLSAGRRARAEECARLGRRRPRRHRPLRHRAPARQSTRSHRSPPSPSSSGSPPSSVSATGGETGGCGPAKRGRLTSRHHPGRPRRRPGRRPARPTSQPAAPHLKPPGCQGGAEPAHIQALLGHDSLDTTARQSAPALSKSSRPSTASSSRTRVSRRRAPECEYDDRLCYLRHATFAGAPWCRRSRQVQSPFFLVRQPFAPNPQMLGIGRAQGFSPGHVRPGRRQESDAVPYPGQASQHGSFVAVALTRNRSGSSELVASPSPGRTPGGGWSNPPHGCRGRRTIHKASRREVHDGGHSMQRLNARCGGPRR